MSQPTPAAIMQIGTGFMASKTLLSAVELGVFSTLANGPADLPTSPATSSRTGSCSREETSSSTHCRKPT
jgi:hypothetical protein